MNKLIVENIVRFVLLLVLQIILSEHLFLGGYILLFIYPLAVMMLPMRLNRCALLAIAFGAGLLVDVFCNIPGLHAFSCTMMAFVRMVWCNRFVSINTVAEFDTPSFRTVQPLRFSFYVFLLLAVYSICYALLESFTFGNFGDTILSALLSLAVSCPVCILLQVILFWQNN